MENFAPKSSVIIMTGMHRSGTSLTASLLQKAGLHLGDRLMGSANGNVKGHFEDLDFVEFHQNVLQSQGISVAGWTEQQQIQVQAQYLASAQRLIDDRAHLPIWGWKDPRTTLFLDFWLSLLPEAKYVFLYRSPWEVTDSLFRRGDVIFLNNPNFAVRQWCNYNQGILDFYEHHSEQCILIEISSVIANQNCLIDLIREKFGWELRSPESVYEPALFNANSDIYYRQALVTKFFPDALDIYHQLQQCADIQPPIIEAPPGIDLTCNSWILQDWVDLKQISKQKQQAEKQLAEINQQLETVRGELAQANQQVETVISELAQANQQIEAVQSDRDRQVAKLHDQSQQQLTQATSKFEQRIEELNNQSQQQLQIAQMEAQQLKLLIVAMESSKFWQLRRRWLDMRQKLNLSTMDTLYQNYLLSTQDSLAVSNVVAPAITVIDGIPVSDNPQYQKWLNKNYPKPAKLRKIKSLVTQLTYQPLVSIIVPVYNAPESFLRQAIESVIEQVYENWELCLADDCSTNLNIRLILEEYALKDERIKVTFRAENGHICQTSNSALELATGEYIALLDHDDLLPPHALATVVELLNQHPKADFIYSDEDKVDADNIHKDPFFKPDWCPDSFLARMYTCHLGIYRRSLVEQIGGFREGFEGSQDYDLVLRITEKTENIYHIPDVLYHWRIHLQSTAADSNVKPYAVNAAQNAIAEALERRDEAAIVTPAKFPGVYTVRYKIRKTSLVSIIIPTKDLADALEVCLKSIFSKTTYPDYEVIVIDNGSREAKTFKCFDYWQQQESDRFKVYKYDVPFNYSQINNYAVTKAEGDYLLFLNNDTEIITPDWIEGMVEQAQRLSIGAVGCLLLYPDNTIQHAGVVLGIGGVAGHSHKHLPLNQPGYISQAVSVNNYSAVTAACLMCRRSVFEEVGGFEEELAIAFNDVDFCLKIISHGYRNIYLPHVMLYHYESKSRGYENTPAKQARFAGEIKYMKQKWQKLCDRDPCYNLNLTKSYEDYSLNI